MTAKAPPIPPAQAPAHRGLAATGAKTSAGAERDINPDQQGRQGNLHQNVETVRAKTQDR